MTMALRVASRYIESYREKAPTLKEREETDIGSLKDDPAVAILKTFIEVFPKGKLPSDLEGALKAVDDEFETVEPLLRGSMMQAIRNASAAVRDLILDRHIMKRLGFRDVDQFRNFLVLKGFHEALVHSLVSRVEGVIPGVGTTNKLSALIRTHSLPVTMTEDDVQDAYDKVVGIFKSINLPKEYEKVDVEEAEQEVEKEIESGKSGQTIESRLRDMYKKFNSDPSWSASSGRRELFLIDGLGGKEELKKYSDLKLWAGRSYKPLYDLLLKIPSIPDQINIFTRIEEIFNKIDQRGHVPVPKQWIKPVPAPVKPEAPVVKPAPAKAPEAPVRAPGTYKLQPRPKEEGFQRIHRREKEKAQMAPGTYKPAPRERTVPAAPVPRRVAPTKD